MLRPSRWRSSERQPWRRSKNFSLEIVVTLTSVPAKNGWVNQTVRASFIETSSTSIAHSPPSSKSAKTTAAPALEPASRPSSEATISGTLARSLQHYQPTHLLSTQRLPPERHAGEHRRTLPCGVSRGGACGPPSLAPTYQFAGVLSHLDDDYSALFLSGS